MGYQQFFFPPKKIGRRGEVYTQTESSRDVGRGGGTMRAAASPPKQKKKRRGKEKDRKREKKEDRLQREIVLDISRRYRGVYPP